MTIKKIRVSNFKSFKELEIELGNFNVLIGANASGKSNFIQIFAFLRDITKHGLDNAISMQGGVEFFRNISIGSDNNFSLEIVAKEDVSEQEPRFWFERNGINIGVKVHEIFYQFSIKFRKKGPGFEISEDKLTQKCEFVRSERKKKKLEEKEKPAEGEFIISIVNRKVKANLNLSQDLSIKAEDLLPWFIAKEKKLPPKNILLEFPFFPFKWGKFFEDISIYNFDPKLPKKAVPVIGKTELEGDGSNLAIVFRKIRANKERRRKFSNLIKDILSFVVDLNVEKFAGRSLIIKLKETYSQEKFLPAFLISDGTMNIAALIIALYFEEKPFIIIEEPERNIHPYLISKVTDMMKDVSKEKQIIITTHNPEIVKYADLKDILLISRDKEGFSKICRPTEKEEIKIFLQNEMGIEELYVQNLLEL